MSDYKDQWFFDIGYQVAFTQIIYCTVVIFSSACPLITPFGFLFFTVKYWVDKYGIVCVYPIEKTDGDVIY